VDSHEPGGDRLGLRGSEVWAVARQIEQGKVRSASVAVTVVTLIILVLAMVVGGLALAGTTR